MRGTRNSFAISQFTQTCKIPTISVPDSNEIFVTASSFNLFEISLPIHHTAVLAPVTYLFTAIAFRCEWVLYAKFSLQGVAADFQQGVQPFSAEKVVAVPWVPDCLRDWERSCEPRACPLCRRPAVLKLCPETNTVELGLATHPSGKISQTSPKDLSVLYESLGLGRNFTPALLDLTFSAVCFLKGSNGLWYIPFSTGFLALKHVDQGSPQVGHLVSQTLLNPNPTWAAQKKDKVLISIL